MTTSYRVPATRPSVRAWLETSIAAPTTRRSTMVARRAWRSVASGVVSPLTAAESPIRVATPPIRPVLYPAARSPDSSRYVDVLLPAVPVTPTSRRRSDGCPYIHAATSPSRARGSATTNTGSPVAIAFSRPAGSVSTATAPAAAAASQNRAPWIVLPGSAAYRSPGRTDLESCVMPVRPPGCPIGPLLAPPGSAGRSPSSAASPLSGRGGTLSGRKAAGTGRGYLPSRRREPYTGRPGIVRCNLHGLQGELHRLEEGRPRDLVTVIPAPRILNVDGHDQLRVVSRGDTDVTRSIQAKTATLAGLGDLGGTGLSRDSVTANETPWLMGLRVQLGDLLQHGHQLASCLSADHAPASRRTGGRELPGCVRRAGDQRRLDPDSAVGDGGVHAGHLDRRHADTLAEGVLEPVVGPVSSRPRPRQQPRALLIEPKSAHRPETERAQVVVLLLRGDVLCDLNHAGVARVREDAGHCVSHGGVVLGIVKRVQAVHGDLVRDCVRRRGRQATTLQRRRDSDWLQRASWREHVRRSDVCRAGIGLGVVRVVGGPLRHRQDRASLRLHHHD